MWKIKSFDPVSHAVNLLDDLDQDVLNVVIPIENRVTTEAKTLWLKTQTDARTAAKAVVAIPGEVKAEANKLVGIYVVMGLHIAVTFVLLVLRLHG
jgi:hypothetical protein